MSHHPLNSQHNILYPLDGLFELVVFSFPIGDYHLFEVIRWQIIRESKNKYIFVSAVFSSLE